MNEFKNTVLNELEACKNEKELKDKFTLLERELKKTYCYLKVFANKEQKLNSDIR
jgi:hypothetical protein